MPVETRKRKATASTAKSLPGNQQLKNPTSINKKKSARVEYKDDDPFFDVFDESSGGESEVEDSDYENNNKRRKKVKIMVKRRKSTNKGPGPAPEAPEMSNDDFRSSDEETAVSQDNTVSPFFEYGGIPGALNIQIPASRSPTTVNVSLANLFAQAGVHLNLQSSNIVQKNISNVIDTNVASPASEVTKLGFLDIPKELRNKVYNQLFVADRPIIFHERDNFSHTAHFLRTCQTVAGEGAVVLYGKNSFHFARTSARRGSYYDKEWKEVGFKDVRRFLNVIGPVNISNMKYVSFLLEDAAPCLTPRLEDAERRYVNDPILLEIFTMIGTNTVLSKLAIKFAGRAQVHSKDVHFLRALAKVKCNHFYKETGWGDRIEDAALHKLKSIMVVKKEANIDEKKVKNVPMLYEKPQKSNFFKVLVKGVLMLYDKPERSNTKASSWRKNRGV